MIELPIGTKFFVVNGLWEGEVIDKSGAKYIKTIKDEFEITKDAENTIVLL